MPELISFPVDADSFVVLSTIVVTQGRDQDSEELVSSWGISFQWLLWGFGLVIEF